MNDEFHDKQKRIRGFLEEHELDALLLRQASNFAWATCGASAYINRADSAGVASLLITRADRYVLTNNIEAARLLQEEGLAEQEWEFRVSPWYENRDEFSELSHAMKLGSDTCAPGVSDFSAEIALLRSHLTPEEGQRFRELGKLCAEGMREVLNNVRPGMSENEIAARLAQAMESRGVQPIINLIATDERVFAYRHPLPTSKELERYAMLILCGRRWGLISSLTRLIHFGPLPEDVRRKAEAVAHIDAQMIAATRPPNTMGEVFHTAQSAYASFGYPQEWQNHHQGGLAGYAPREITALPLSAQRIHVGQAYAWNPSIAGVKSEDTILVGEHRNEVLTEMRDWPTIGVQIGDQTIQRPAILER